jgi:hypothetical protein
MDVAEVKIWGELAGAVEEGMRRDEKNFNV